MRILLDCLNRIKIEILASVIMLFALWPQVSITVFVCLAVLIAWIIRLRLQTSYQQTLNIQMNTYVQGLQKKFDELVAVFREIKDLLDIDGK
jgi:membrane protein implicated in regulation of membrane protease activity